MTRRIERCNFRSRFYWARVALIEYRKLAILLLRRTRGPEAKLSDLSRRTETELFFSFFFNFVYNFLFYLIVKDALM